MTHKQLLPCAHVCVCVCVRIVNDVSGVMLCTPLCTDIVAEKFAEQDIRSTDGVLKEFKPHVTILKFSRLYEKGQPEMSKKMGTPILFLFI